MPQQNYLDELTPAFTSLLAIKEASRCLLCHDAPCSQAHSGTNGTEGIIFANCLGSAFKITKVD